ncbi:hypothetical protein BLNAU_6392 [Blattamonas nauphoetae]|uniref:Secreted protein n=1 Tax=Blattamonas nauphoetae TaxID=2049346 RepID=A0ABQ9Y4E9_9EUKA|nr:hypothetical protein BLNAU_6392 [Blattamonas nauphoetae]
MVHHPVLLLAEAVLRVLHHLCLDEHHRRGVCPCGRVLRKCHVPNDLLLGPVRHFHIDIRPLRHLHLCCEHPPNVREMDQICCRKGELDCRVDTRENEHRQAWTCETYMFLLVEAHHHDSPLDRGCHWHFCLSSSLLSASD